MNTTAPEGSADSNIILFPGWKQASPPQSLEDIRSNIEEHRLRYAKEASEELWATVMETIARDGYDIAEMYDDIHPSISLVLDSIYALYLRVNGIEHPLQDTADGIYPEAPPEHEEVDTECDLV